MINTKDISYHLSAILSRPVVYYDDINKSPNIIDSALLLTEAEKEQLLGWIAKAKDRLGL